LGNSVLERKMLLFNENRWMERYKAKANPEMSTAVYFHVVDAKSDNLLSVYTPFSTRQSSTDPNHLSDI
jgi:hypothetical protein